jgi:dihydroorotase-like cyclic amidohydrolase
MLASPPFASMPATLTLRVHQVIMHIERALAMMTHNPLRCHGAEPQVRPKRVRHGDVLSLWRLDASLPGRLME